jgi:hypothetical protein
MRQTRHKSVEVARRYMRSADLRRNNVTERVLRSRDRAHDESLQDGLDPTFVYQTQSSGPAIQVGRGGEIAANQLEDKRQPMARTALRRQGRQARPQ